MPGETATEATAEGARDDGWDPTPTQQWIEEVEAWQWIPEPSPLGGILGWYKTGTCPRCLHTITVRQESGVAGLSLTKARQRFARLAETERKPVNARCNCSGNHANRPSAWTTGCGQQGVIHFPSTGGEE